MFRRLRKPVTHAAALWMLVGLAAGMLLAVLAYASLLANVGKVGVRVFPPRSPKPAEQLPSLFGTVIAVEGEEVAVESKQPFKKLVIDKATSLTSVGGAEMALSDIRLGAVITATGKDLGNGKLAATAVVVLENPETDMAPPPTSLLRPPADWREWAAMPALIGWGRADGEYAFALRGYDLDAPAVSVELYGWDGKLKERVELDVPGYVRLKRLNDFLTPEEAEKRLTETGIAIPPDPPVPEGWLSPDGRWLLQVVDGSSGRRDVRFSRTSGG